MAGTPPRYGGLSGAFLRCFFSSGLLAIQNMWPSRTLPQPAFFLQGVKKTGQKRKFSARIPALTWRVKGVLLSQVKQASACFVFFNFNR